MSLSELPLDELRLYAQSLGLTLASDAAQGEALRAVRERQELLITLDRDALLDVVAWLRCPVRPSAGREELAAVITRHDPVEFTDLSDRGLRVFAALKGVSADAADARDIVERKLRGVGGLRARWRHVRRRAVGAIVDRLVAGTRNSADGAYQFLPEEDVAPTLRTDIEKTGLVGGVARRIKGAADDYIKTKLDEIEIRIDRKLDEIDRRLGEWRDREVANRLRILKFTLLISILVAALSLLYDYVSP